MSSTFDTFSADDDGISRTIFLPYDDDEGRSGDYMAYEESYEGKEDPIGVDPQSFEGYGYGSGATPDFGSDLNLRRRKEGEEGFGESDFGRKEAQVGGPTG